MGELVQPRILKWTLTSSIGLHVALLLGLFVKFAPNLPPVPIGVEIRYSEPGVPMAEPAKPTVRKSLPVAKREAGKGDVKAEPEVLPSGGAAMGAQDGAIVSALERYKFELRLFLDSRKIYPETARRLRQTGTVVVRFRVNDDGVIEAADLESPSASESLNRAALDLVKRAGRFKPLPEGVDRLDLSFPIEYIL